MPACIIMNEKEKEWTWVAWGMGRIWKKLEEEKP